MKKEILFQTTFNQYQAVNIIGEGGSGRVYEVRDDDGNKFALKSLSPEKITNEKKKRFKNESVLIP